MLSGVGAAQVGDSGMGDEVEQQVEAVPVGVVVCGCGDVCMGRGTAAGVRKCECVWGVGLCEQGCSLRDCVGSGHSCASWESEAVQVCCVYVCVHVWMSVTL